MKNRILLVLLAVMLALSVGLVGCGGEPASEITEYTLTISSTDGGDSTCVPAADCTCGEGTKDSGGVTVPEQCVCVAGTEVSILASPAFGYRFVGWTGDVETIADVKAATTTITMSGNYSITANFEAVPSVQYDLTVASTAGGNVTTPGEGTFTYPEGAVVNLVATPTTGYQFVNWTGDVSTMGNVNAASTTITMNDDYSIKANFAVSFPDANLEVAIREALGRPTEDIYQSNLDTLTIFDAENRNITDLTGLEHCTNLAHIDLDYNQISNVSPLANLTSLTVLGIGHNQITDILPLANLTNLTSLHLQGNQISDISPLANLTNLTSLHLVVNQISDISPLANLTNLTSLHLQGNQIGHISPLANLTNLTSLLLTNNHISNVSPLANLTSLTWLALTGNQISDISPLLLNSGLATGDGIDLTNNPLSSDSINIYIPQLRARGVTVYY